MIPAMGLGAETPHCVVESSIEDSAVRIAVEDSELCIGVEDFEVRIALEPAVSMLVEAHSILAGIVVALQSTEEVQVD